MNIDIQDTSEVTTPISKESLRNILIVEDEPLIGWSVANTLKKAGYQVTVVDSGEKAIERMNSAEFDLIVTDFKLPKISGIAVAANAKSRYPTIPVILMSAYEECRMLIDSFQRNVDLYMQKPFDLSELTIAVRSLTK